ncbi:zinc finger matrin-type protein 5 [Microplitis demolitor]|uniref:zinc finger matrin-type protein 5 n=1 Tax=Microplitis demolitor TaxID=69319 RepID=UPI0004CD0524|nr:zinc finger matrin-type protein 5 [Microplitis demolitor]XP_053599107.1 zinc finger matrin-type protein 5 [Microplitis demolitor]XP_053599108.1 zinc finger matrin-type protein 5 [Microplitis demolitor]XP_053599109.1 zinc finger matrin-type protein 5 [Microplitis demolitor]
MGKRYYCDYCDRSFKDDPEARKKHISSLQHVNKRSEYYQQFKDPQDILEDESWKITCKKLFTSGECAFGNNCKFSHYSPLMIQELEKIVAWRKQSKSVDFIPKKSNLYGIINEYFENPFVTDYSQVNYPVWNTTTNSENYGNLPPSLSLMTSKHVTDSNFEKWGLYFKS